MMQAGWVRDRVRVSLTVVSAGVVTSWPLRHPSRQARRLVTGSCPPTHATVVQFEHQQLAGASTITNSANSNLARATKQAIEGSPTTCNPPLSSVHVLLKNISSESRRFHFLACLHFRLEVTSCIAFLKHRLGCESTLYRGIPHFDLAGLSVFSIPPLINTVGLSAALLDRSPTHPTGMRL